MFHLKGALSSLFDAESEEKILLKNLIALEKKKIGWADLFSRVEDRSKLSRIYLNSSGRSILHLAVIDNVLDVIKEYKNDLHLRAKRDLWGLNPIELAQVLNRKEALSILQQKGESRLDLKGIDYLQFPTFESVNELDELLVSVAQAKEKDLVPPEKIWLGIYYDKELFMGKESNISLNYIDEKMGYGVFANENIIPCSYIAEYTGVIKQKNIKELKSKKYCVALPEWVGKKHFCIDSEKLGNFTRYINHSVNPNIMLQSVYLKGLPRMIFIALKKIEIGEELTFDYGEHYWK